MDSMFGETFMFLTKLAWKSRITLPMLVTAVFLAMDFRIQIEINVHTERLLLQDHIDSDNDDDDASINSDDTWETVDDTDEEIDNTLN